MLHHQVLRFAVVGVVGFLVDAGTLSVLVPLLGSPILSQGIAFFLAVTATWWLNRRITFAHAADHRLLREWFRYLSANSVGALANNGLYVVLVIQSAFFSDHPVVAVALGSIAGAIWNFSAAKFLVFRHKDTDRSAKEEVCPEES